jgi:hypothetical protein
MKKIFGLILSLGALFSVQLKLKFEGDVLLKA